MSGTPESLPTISPTSVSGLGHRAMKGLVWVVASTVGTKLFSFGGQLVIAWLLIPQELGVVALAYSVTAFTTVLQKNGLREILVQRGPRLGNYLNAAFWMSLFIGLAVAGLTLAASPIAVHIYHDRRLYSILAILALSAPLLSLQSVPGAQLQSEMRFRALSGFAIFESVGITTFTILFALKGFGPYSVVLPGPIVQLISVIGMFFLTRPALRMQLDRVHWRELFTQSGLMLGSSLLYAFNLQGANMVLGIFHSATLVGTFFFANNLVSQLTNLVANNLWYVLLPSFSQLQDDVERLGDVFVRVILTSNVIGMPVCFLLAVLAEPLLHLFYGVKWEAAIPAIQILSLGMLFNIAFSLSITLMLARGQFGLTFHFNIYRAAGFIFLVTLGAWLGGINLVSLGSALFMLVFGPVATYLALKPLGRGWHVVFRVHAAPLFLGLLASVAAVLVLKTLPHSNSRQLSVQLLTASAAYFLIYIPLIRFFIPTVWYELGRRISGLFNRSLNPTASA